MSRAPFALKRELRAEDVSATLDMALKASGCNCARVVHKPRLLSDNGSSYISGALAHWLHGHPPNHPADQGGSREG